MTQLVEWSSDLSVGLEEIDDQHKVLVGLLNKFHDAVQQRHGSEAVQDVLRELAEYTRVHFAVEEALMRILDYPDYAKHKAEHDDLIHQVTDLQQKLATGKHSVNFELLHFLKMWLTKHIIESDKQYSPYFLAKGALATGTKRSWFTRFWHGWGG